MNAFSSKLIDAAEAAEARVAPIRTAIEKNEELCSRRVLEAFADNRISAAHLLGTSGYGYGDLGREALDRVYARVYGKPDAFVRIQMVSGTHAIATALGGVLRPGDRVLCVTGKPYDTILPTIAALGEYGIGFDYMEFDGRFDEPSVSARLQAGYRMVYVQRSRGYTLRRSLLSDEITALYRAVKKIASETVFFVDNCYGEFVCPTEPEADLLAGSLIKNAGGGLCPCGGYLAGETALIDRCADRLFAAGIGREVGATQGNNLPLFMGLFMAPHATAEALKTAVFAASLFDRLGFDTAPTWDEPRGDIVQLLLLGGPERLIAFCKGLQSGSPVDSHVTPEPWDMPGYDDKVIMAAGGFISGSSVEISADAPLREPYAVWLQGGLTYATGKYAVLKAAQNVIGD